MKTVDSLLSRQEFTDVKEVRDESMQYRFHILSKTSN